MKKILRILIILAAFLPFIFSQQVSADSGDIVEEIIIDGPPEPPPGYPHSSVVLADPHQLDDLSIITSIPAFDWSFGCSATSAAMIAGYYDRNGYPNMYAGPTHGGIMPLNNSYWPDWTGDEAGATRHQCPLSATHNGLDGRSTRGHVDDYWRQYGSSADDPWITNGWTEHTYGDCTGDYMYTNQSSANNSDGSTRFWGYDNDSKLQCDTLETWGGEYLIDGTLGLRNFYESRGYTVPVCYYQKTDNQYSGGFDFDDYKVEIDAGRPVMIHVVGHTMVGFGYEDDGSNTMYIHDTWDHDAHTMTWGGSYSGMELMAVSIVHLGETGSYSTQTGNWNTAATWDAGVPGTSSNVTIKSGHTVTLDTNVQVENLAIEYDATLVIPDGFTLAIEDTFVNNGAIQQTLNVPSGSTTEFLHITNAADSQDKYYGVEITPDSTSMGSTTVTIDGNHTGGCTTVPGDPLLYRCFEITPTSQESATIKFWFDEDERNGQDANALKLWHNDGGSSWSEVLGSYNYSESTTDCQTGDGQKCWMEVSGVSSYSVFDIGSGDEPTVIKLTDLSAATRETPFLLLSGITVAAVVFALGLKMMRDKKESSRF